MITKRTPAPTRRRSTGGVTGYPKVPPSPAKLADLAVQRSQLSGGRPADVRHRQLIARRRGAMGVQFGSMGVQVGFTGRFRKLPWLDRAASDSSTHSCRSTNRRARGQSNALQINLGAIAHRAMWGYGVESPLGHSISLYPPVSGHAGTSPARRLPPAPGDRRSELSLPSWSGLCSRVSLLLR